MNCKYVRQLCVVTEEQRSIAHETRKHNRHLMPLIT